MAAISLENQVAIVTGAGRGIGRSVALELAQLGASVVVNDIERIDDGQMTSADQVVTEICASAGKAVASSDSVATVEGAQGIVNVALENFGTVDIVVNNAAIWHNAYFHEMTVTEWDEVIAVHLRGSFLVTQCAWKVMKEKRYGRVVTMSSNAGAWGRDYGANYCAAKGALIGLTNALAHEGRKYGIYSNAVLPGASQVNPVKQSIDFEERYSKVPKVQGRFEPDRVAKLVCYLASRECTVNGEVLSALLGRYPHAFMGITSGWVGPEEFVSPDDISTHLPAIEDRSTYTVPRHLLDELASAAESVLRTPLQR